MTLLVADVGGTNTRIALYLDRRGITEAEHFQNADFASFDEVLLRYSATRDLTGLTGVCIAVAGPVTAGRATLTNRNWRFDTHAIASSLPSRAAVPVHLVNDLMALGFSLPELTPDQQALIRPSRNPEPLNNQALVVGVGTGFNICVVKPVQDKPVVIAAELGHASLPISVYNALANEIGSVAKQFSTFEHLLSGRGLTRIFRQFSGGDELSGRQILAGYDPSQQNASVQAIELFGRVMGIVAREMVFQYLPYGGIHFAGGVARGILGSPAKATFLTAFEAPGPFDAQTSLVPVQIITDDAAALVGAAQYARIAA